MEISSTQVCEELLVCLKRIKTVMAQLAEANQLTSQQLFALQAIQSDTSTMGQLAAYLHCDASNVTGIVDRLVAHKLVMRKESAQDRRTKLLHLTQKGQELMQDIERKLPKMLGCEKLQQSERQALHKVIAKLAV
jgi:DNA-binding MarR family transcriptional regulator